MSRGVLRLESDDLHFDCNGLATRPGPSSSSVAPVLVDPEYQVLVAGYGQGPLLVRRQQAPQVAVTTTCTWTSICLIFVCVLVLPMTGFYSLLSYSLWSLPKVPSLGTEPLLPHEARNARAGEHVCSETQWNSTRPAQCGARLWASQAALDHLGEDVLPSVLGRFSRLAQQLAAEVGGKPTTSAGFTWEVFDVRIEKLAVASAAFSFAAGRGLQHSVQGVELGLSLRYTSQGSGLLAFFFTSGQIVLKLGAGTGYSGLLEVDVDPFGRPSLALSDSRVELDFHATFNEEGGSIFFQALVNCLFNSFKWILEEALEDLVEVMLTQAISEDFTAMIAEVDPLVPLESGCLAIDMAACSVATYEDHLEIMVHGAVVDVSRPGLVYPEQVQLAPPMPESIQHEMVGVSINSWLANSVAWTFMQDQLDLNVSISLNKELADLHNLLEWVWPKLDLGLEVTLADAPKISLDEGEIRVKATIRMDIMDYGSGRNLLASSVPLEAWFAVDIQDEKLQMNVDQLTILGISLDAGECNTVLGTKCIFPFTYDGTTYDSCTDAGTKVHRYWCATSVDPSGNYIKNKWGTCTAKCHAVSNYIMPWLNDHLSHALEEFVHPVVDLRKPLGDVLVLENTTLRVLFDWITVRSDFRLDLTGFLGARYGRPSAELLLQGRSFASLA